MNIFKKMIAYLAIRSKMIEANKKFKATGKRHFVIPVHGVLETLCVDEALTLKKQGVLPADLSKKTIYGASFYWSDTTSPNPAAKGAMPKYEYRRRRKVFYEWYERNHK